MIKTTRLIWLLALLSMAAIPALGAATTALAVWGGWPLCADGLDVQGCSSYVPGTETYMLMIHGDTTLAVAYGYSITVTLQDGTVKTVQGMVRRTDNSGGYTVVLPLTFGGIVQTSSVTTDEFALVGTTTSVSSTTNAVIAPGTIVVSRRR